MEKLGFGLMRLPMLKNDKVDMEQLKTMVDMYIAAGGDYFDTAWMYCGFQSEEAIKEALVQRYPRDSYKLVTKLHAGFLKTKEDRDKIFQAQLDKTGAGYFDNYLLHDVGVERYPILEKLDCFTWVQEKKAQGLIKHVGFSCHDNAEFLDRFLTDHPEMEFVQLQINYLDWENEGIQSRKCYEVAVKHGKPVIVMEPVKGGTLASVPTEAEEMLKAYAPDRSIPSWAMRFCASLDSVTMVLSGMSNVAQMEDNIRTMTDFVPMTKDELNLVAKTVDIINASVAIPCTGCAYCTDGCPMNIPIPRYFTLYNLDKQEVATKGWTPQGEYYERLSMTCGKASACIACGQCEEACPQHLPIIEHLKTVAEYFE